MKETLRNWIASRIIRLGVALVSPLDDERPPESDDLFARIAARIEAELADDPAHIEHKRLVAIMPKRPGDYAPYGEVERWADPLLAYPDCSCGCKFANWLESNPADWCVCTNPASHRCGLLTFEHQGCQAFEEEARVGA